MDHETIERESLIERYVAGKLLPAEVAAFEEHYLDCDQCLDQVEAAERLQRGLQRVAKEETAKTLRKSFLVTLLASSRARTGLLLAAFFVAFLIPLLWQLQRVARLRGDLDVAHRELEAARSGDLEQVAALRQELDEARRALDAADSRWSTDMEAVKEESARLAAQLTAVLAPQVNARIFSLSPFRDVGIGETPHHQIDLPAGDAWIVLSLDAAVGGEAAAHRAVLQREGKVVWRADNLEPDEFGSVVVTFPPGFLKAGKYRLDLAGVGNESSVTRYPIRAKALDKP